MRTIGRVFAWSTVWNNTVTSESTKAQGKNITRAKLTGSLLRNSYACEDIGLKLGATTIAEAVVARIFPIPRHLCVSNVSWSLLPYEADLIAVTGSGYMIEVEIKISLSDLKRDAGKSKWRYQAFDNLVSRFYYAMPDALWLKSAAQEAVPEWAGVITVSGDGEAIVVREASRRQARALTNSERFNLARVGSFRAWSPALKHRARQLRAKHELEKRKQQYEWEQYIAKRKAEQA